MEKQKSKGRGGGGRQRHGQLRCDDSTCDHTDPARCAVFCGVPACDHQDPDYCPVLRAWIMESSGVNHGPTAVAQQLSWVNMHHVRRRTGIVSGIRRVPGVPFELSDFLRDIVATTLICRMLGCTRDMSHRISSGPICLPCTGGQFRSIFGHLRRDYPGILIKATRSKTTGLERVTVTITCMNTLLKALRLAPHQVL